MIRNCTLLISKSYFNRLYYSTNTISGNIIKRCSPLLFNSTTMTLSRMIKNADDVETNEEKSKKKPLTAEQKEKRKQESKEREQLKKETRQKMIEKTKLQKQKQDEKKLSKEKEKEDLNEDQDDMDLDDEEINYAESTGDNIQRKEKKAKVKPNKKIQKDKGFKR
ncbi:hypothetical protein DLAC_02683 [Tieghemostelium lacteum]|uniref:Uncharacterized protein n=1 Tax=Tieghemostelium lacteum TaxID=361077 RepID=A0A152A319_TIELA|nr:hypothetical protein DLAC_02683 [Tieghemostelium lacteum]|eukprot:KYR00653.1 hypothetical protein DLAC_02683 [Tieghemostelium lacteum]